MELKLNLQKALSLLVVVAMLAVSFVFMTTNARAASVTSLSDTMTRQIISTASDHTIVFTTPTGIAASATVTLTFTAGFDISSIAFGDIDVQDDGVDVTVATAPLGVIWGAAVAGQVLTLTNGTTPVAAGSVVTVKIGTVATGGTNQIVNPGTASATATSYSVAIAGTFGDTGTAILPILSDDQVHITATVDSELTFALHDAADDSGSSFFTDHANIIDLGTLSSAAVQYAVEGAGSGGSAATVTGGAHGFRVGTNGTSGYNTTVTGATLTSGANTITAIGAAAAASAAGTEQFGLCLSDDTTGAAGTTATDATQQGTIVAAYSCGGTGFAFNAGALNSIATGNAAGPTSMTFYDVQYIANVSALTEAGLYQTDLTYTTTATF